MQMTGSFLCGPSGAIREAPRTASGLSLLALILVALASFACQDGGNAQADGGASSNQVPADPDAFVTSDSIRILDELRLLSSDSLEGRRTGERGADMARDYLVYEMNAAGVQAPPDGRIQPFEFRNRRDTTRVLEGGNVVGVVAGSQPELGAIVLTAHFDHLGIRLPRQPQADQAEIDSIYNGADDNASGTVAVLSMARYFAAHQPRHTMVFAAVDGEEMGSPGAREFMEKGWPERIVLNVNLDMVSRSDSLLFAAGPFHYPQLRTVLETVSARRPVVIRFGHDQRGIEGMDDWTGSSDHRVFHQAGIPFVYFGVEDHPDYHRPSDEFEKVDPGFYLNAIRTILASVLALDLGLEDAAPSSG